MSTRIIEKMHGVKFTKENLKALYIESCKRHKSYLEEWDSLNENSEQVWEQVQRYKKLANYIAERLGFAKS